MWVDNCAIPGAIPFGKYLKRVTVKMHRMRGLIDSIQHDANRFASSEIIDVPVWVWNGEVAFVGEEEKRIVIIRSLCSVVHGPQMVACFVGVQIDLNRGCNVGFLQGLWVERDCFVQVVL